jgi:hypothetical protein
VTVQRLDPRTSTFPDVVGATATRRRVDSVCGRIRAGSTRDLHGSARDSTKFRYIPTIPTPAKLIAQGQFLALLTAQKAGFVLGPGPEYSPRGRGFRGSGNHTSPAVDGSTPGSSTMPRPFPRTIAFEPEHIEAMREAA